MRFCWGTYVAFLAASVAWLDNHHAAAQDYVGKEVEESLLNTSPPPPPDVNYAHPDPRREITIAEYPAYITVNGRRVAVLQRPYSRIGLFTLALEGDTGRRRCSAFLVGPRTALTAAHCVFECKSGVGCKGFKSGDVQFGMFYDAEKRLRSMCNVHADRAEASHQYLQFQRDQKSDYAAVYFPRGTDLYKSCNFDSRFPLGVRYGLPLSKVRIVGYPAHVPATVGNEIARTTLWYADGPVKIANGQIVHQIATTPGNSGGPILAWSGDRYVAVGITSGGYWAGSNSDVYFNSQNQQEINNLIAKGN